MWVTSDRYLFINAIFKGSIRYYVEWHKYLVRKLQCLEFSCSMFFHLIFLNFRMSKVFFTERAAVILFYVDNTEQTYWKIYEK